MSSLTKLRLLFLSPFYRLTTCRFWSRRVFDPFHNWSCRRVGRGSIKTSFLLLYGALSRHSCTCVFSASFLGWMYGFFVFYRSFTLICSCFRSFLIVFAQLSVPSLLERSLCTFTYNFVFPPSYSSDFCDFYDYISSGRVHIFPRWTLAYQVSIL